MICAMTTTLNCRQAKSNDTMGSVNSAVDDRRPKSLAECLDIESDSSGIDVVKFMSYQAQLQDKLDSFHESISA
jgi:hypothetical protein